MDALQQALDETRQRFTATFPSQCDGLRILIDRIAQYGADGPVPALAQTVHRLSGLAGTIGFPAISARASELEELVAATEDGAFDTLRAGGLVDAMLAAFAAELARFRSRATA